MSNDPVSNADATARVESMEGAGTTHMNPGAAAPAAEPAARRRRSGVLAFLGRVLRLSVAVALFSLGVLAGVRVFALNLPPAPVTGDPSVAGVPPPAVVVELANAIGAEDPDAIRAAMTPDIFDSYTAELQQYGIVSVDAVETLGTFVDGPRHATMLVIHAHTADGNPFTLYLVVLTEDGTIVRLR